MSVAVMAILILISFSLANIQSFLWMSSDWLVSTILPAVIVDLTNEARGSEAVGTLRRSSVLDEAAQQKANDMAKEGYFAHYSPEGVAPWFWFDESGYNFVHAGENLAVYFTDSEDVVDAWMSSPGHRANILNGDFTEIGVGTAKGTYEGYDTVFVVQFFGTPASTPLRTQTVAGESVAAPVATAIPAAQTVAPEALGDTTDTPARYSDLATTSRDAEASSLGTGTGIEAPTAAAGIFGRIATNPNTMLQILYALLALFVAASLILSIVMEWRKQHPIQIAYGGGLLAAMALLFYIHVALTAGVTII